MACPWSCACDPPSTPLWDHAQNLEEQLTLNGGRREVSILSHRPVTSSDLKQDRLFFRESVSKFLQLVEALYMGGSRVPSSYLIGTMLLESYVPYWSISFNTEDISQEEGRRWPTAKQVSDLRAASSPFLWLMWLPSVLVTEEFLIRLSRWQLTIGWVRCLSTSDKFRNYKVCTSWSAF